MMYRPKNVPVRTFDHPRPPHPPPGFWLAQKEGPVQREPEGHSEFRAHVTSGPMSQVGERR